MPYIDIVMMQLRADAVHAERLRRLELYGHDKHHPADEPHRHAASVLVFHLADVDTIDAS